MIGRRATGNPLAPVSPIASRLARAPARSYSGAAGIPMPLEPMESRTRLPPHRDAPRRLAVGALAAGAWPVAARALEPGRTAELGIPPDLVISGVVVASLAGAAVLCVGCAVAGFLVGRRWARRRLATADLPAAPGIDSRVALVCANLSQLASRCRRLRSQLEALDDGASRSDFISECGGLLDESIEGAERSVSIVREMEDLSRVGTDER